MRPTERKAMLEQIAAMITRSEMSLGDAARLLRSGVLKMSRQEFASAIGVSVRAIAKLEDGVAANPTLDTLRRVFAPFGAAIGLVFPSMTTTEPQTPEADETRRSLLDALGRSRRQRRSRAVSHL